MNCRWAVLYRILKYLSHVSLSLISCFLFLVLSHQMETLLFIMFLAYVFDGILKIVQTIFFFSFLSISWALSRLKHANHLKFKSIDCILFYINFQFSWCWMQNFAHLNMFNNLKFDHLTNWQHLLCDKLYEKCHHKHAILLEKSLNNWSKVLLSTQYKSIGMFSILVGLKRIEWKQNENKNYRRKKTLLTLLKDEKMTEN